MILSKRVSLNNRYLDEVNKRIVITSIEEAAGKETLNTAAAAGWMGTRITQRRRDTLDVTIRFRILAEKRAMDTREAVLEKINNWAYTNDGGWLRIDHKQNRRLQVVLVQPATVADPWNWTDEYTMIFRAYSVPYWEADGSVSQWTFPAKTSGAAEGEGTIEVGGTAKTQPGITITNKSGKTINKISLTIGSRTMSFTGLGLLEDQQLVIGYRRTSEICVPSIKIGNRSVMAARTPESNDEFDIAPGKKTVKWKADRAVYIAITFRERYI